MACMCNTNLNLNGHAWPDWVAKVLTVAMVVLPYTDGNLGIHKAVSQDIIKI